MSSRRIPRVKSFFLIKAEKQYAKFVLIEIFTFLIGFSIFYLLTNNLKINYIISAIMVGIINFQTSYFLNKKITFNKKIKKHFERTYFKFGFIRIFSGGVYLILFFIFVNFVFGSLYLSYFLAIFIGGLTNFVLNKFFNFNKN
ncbi:MAG: GtrA family protein [Nanoarchaeota archaeon]|nr:GtrA family protein [Nanoarchaeota archaeon]